MKIVRSNVVNQVIEYLRSNIERGVWEVGRKIPSENELTRTLEVSRASVRVAIQQFIATGVLESIHGKGTFLRHTRMDAFQQDSTSVRDEDFDDIRTVLEFRRIVESETALLAAKNRDDNAVETLHSSLMRMKENVGDRRRFVDCDIEFHKVLAKASGNHLLERCLVEVFEKTRKSHEQMNAIFGAKDGVYYHTRILDAIVKQNAGMAKRLMVEHMQQAIDRL
jgi:GntR family transcriptional regulator, transcriptional repressor for pyruvate dehydrogenase complex